MIITLQVEDVQEVVMDTIRLDMPKEWIPSLAQRMNLIHGLELIQREIKERYPDTGLHD